MVQLGREVELERLWGESGEREPLQNHLYDSRGELEKRSSELQKKDPELQAANSDLWRKDSELQRESELQSPQGELEEVRHRVEVAWS